ncbi:protein ZINC INDUCED FACILITATOR-LIKE 1-like isoform X2 [Ziziphus jujuba]|uniref:Protein ZINC INDUCED FACILITATOR-LIKE 1-like isoform X2 n=1 Tax=Ziziphus jujuba TaxID=326968 RepID=A0ABM3IDP7_ZIZJJ|nr:protein ZINC INDUCED FACILITATOR-LIKE 1-like isoform X2 [Ziziphus jujuba]
MAEESRERLLKKVVYYENCPGCKVDQYKETQRGLPIRDLLFIGIVVLCNVLPISSLFPFLYYMIRDFHIAEREEDISFYGGFVGCSFMVGRALTSIFWGVVADRYGRKPVIMIGTIVVVVFNTLFGLSVNFWMAIVTRFLLGSLNGLLGPIKAYASEIFREEYQALGLATVSTAWGIGLIIGPAIGGYLAQETLHKHHENSRPSADSEETLDAYYVSDTKKTNQKAEAEKTSKKSLLRNWPLMSAIIVYCFFSLHDMAYSEIFSLWATSPRKLGGLSYTTDQVGEVLAVSGFSLLIFQSFLYPPVEKAIGAIATARIAGVLSIPLLTSYPYIALLSGFTLTWVLNLASLVKNVLSTSIITGLFLLQNRAVEQDQRGAANGISMTMMSVFKAIGPAAGGAILSWAQKRQHASFLPGDHLVFFILNVIEALGVLMTFKPFLAAK